MFLVSMEKGMVMVFPYQGGIHLPTHQEISSIFQIRDQHCLQFQFLRQYYHLEQQPAVNNDGVFSFQQITDMCK